MTIAEVETELQWLWSQQIPAAHNNYNIHDDGYNK